MNMMKNDRHQFIFLIALLILLACVQGVYAATTPGGCCADQGGVCGCVCCDGSPLVPSCVMNNPGCRPAGDAAAAMSFTPGMFDEAPSEYGPNLAWPAPGELSFLEPPRRIDQPPSAATLAVYTISGASPAQILINGRKLDTPGFVIDGRTMAPLRELFETLGGEIEYDAAEHKILIRLERRAISLVLGHPVAYIAEWNSRDGVDLPWTLTMDVAPYAVNGLTYVSLRFVSQLLNGDLEWDPESNTARIHRTLARYKGRWRDSFPLP